MAGNEKMLNFEYILLCVYNSCNGVSEGTLSGNTMYQSQVHGISHVNTFVALVSLYYMC